MMSTQSVAHILPATMLQFPSPTRSNNFIVSSLGQLAEIRITN